MSDTLVAIPLSKLTHADSNIRKTDPTAGLEELAASIEAHGLLQNLTVRPIRKSNGDATDRFEVVAGGRRLSALKLLAERKRVAKNAQVPCRVLAEDNPVEVSLAENIVRAPVHPADQFEAFSALHAQGQGAEDIAARFGIAPSVVLQRMKLAAVSPRLLAVYREGGMTLEQLMAFTVSDDHEAQERVWFENPYREIDAQSIRSALTQALVEGRDRRARFVGAEAYKAAGGIIFHDLFRPEEDGYFTDSLLLDRLVTEKLDAAAEAVLKEGWAWVEVLPAMDYGYLARFRRIPSEPVPLPEADQARLDELSAKYDGLIEEHGENAPEEVEAQLETLSEEIEAFSRVQERWSPEEMGKAGVLVALDPDGAIHMERGLMKPGETAPEPATGPDKPAKRENKREAGEPEVSEALLEDLSGHRTAALRAMLAEKPIAAFVALLHTLVLRTFYRPEGDTCVDVRTTALDLKPFAQSIGETKAAKAIAELRERWMRELPQEESALWAWIEDLEFDTQLELLAFCVAGTVNAVRERHRRADGIRFAQAEQVAMAVGLDMADWWRPTRLGYLGRVSKARLLAAVSEAVSPQAAENIAHMKKEAMAVRAEELLATIRWVPKELRTRTIAGTPSQA